MNLAALLQLYALPFVRYGHSYTGKSTVKGTGSHKQFKSNLPLWTVGKHQVHAKNPKDALKYIKKRGLWDGKSYPMRIV